MLHTNYAPKELLAAPELHPVRHQELLAVLREGQALGKVVAVGRHTGRRDGRQQLLLRVRAERRQQQPVREHRHGPQQLAALQVAGGSGVKVAQDGGKGGALRVRQRDFVGGPVREAASKETLEVGAARGEDASMRGEGDAARDDCNIGKRVAAVDTLDPVARLPPSTFGRAFAASGYALSRSLYHAEFAGLPTGPRMNRLRQTTAALSLEADFTDLAGTRGFNVLGMAAVARPVGPACSASLQPDSNYYSRDSPTSL
ncbi:hypothetical protein TSOC_003643, partial [Tetrabaena socialis]